ncbi:hypothetical protein AB4865_03795 [Capnocytophaga sp. ARDL2]|uniref:hypothetical protein n=1 Tax=Capnocytophaga sp. ARDL2 TaxID=3238809 RepID=UPI003557DD30
MKKSLLVIVFIMTTLGTYAQVGIGTLNPNQSAILDVVAYNKGILIPRVTLQDTTDITTVQTASNGTYANSLLVFNTTNNENISPGYYYWYEDKWHKIITQTEVSTEVIEQLILENQKTIALENGNFTQVVAAIDSNNLNHTTWKTNVDIAKGALNNESAKYGVVKEKEIAPTISVSQSGELDLNIENINNIKIINNNYTVSFEDSILLGNASTSNVNLTLPSAINNKGKRLIIKKEDTNEDYYITVTGNIFGVPQGLYTALPFSGWEFVSDGTQWRIVNKF